MIIFKRKLNSDIKSCLDISMQLVDVLRFFTPDYVQSVAHLTMASFRNLSIYSPLCLCGNVESTDHYFLRCRFYHAQRAGLTQHNPVTLQALVLGNPLLSLPTNILIFEAVHKYITDMERF